MKEGANQPIKHIVLAVDDEVHALKLFQRSFRKEYDVITTSDPQEAIDIIMNKKDDLAAILCDQMMPKVKGVEVLRVARDLSPNTIRIMVTAFIDTNVLMECINDCEAYCYILKPWDASELGVVLKQALLFRERDLKNKLIVNDLRDLLFGTIGAICEALDEKDKYAIGHSRRVTSYSLLIGTEMGLGRTHLQKLQLAGLLHDIGKIGTPEHILNKPGKLTDEEFEVIKRHPDRGANIIKELKQLGDVIDWVKCHHERYDGRGYPSKLAGDEIPLGAAILAVADTYDAMTSDRSYRKGLPHQVAFNEIVKCAGTQFNPNVAEAFTRIEGRFEEALKHKDNGKEYTVSHLLTESKGLVEKMS
ncbi:MAG: HD domain-containing phosphohydrolase [Cyanobacteriota bacterium]